MTERCWTMGAPCQRLTLFDASRRSLLPNLAPHYAYIITCIDKQCERGFNSLYSHFTFNGKRPLSLPPPHPPLLSSFWNIIYLLRGYMHVYNVIVDTLPWTEIQIATFRAMNMDLFNNNNNATRPLSIRISSTEMPVPRIFIKHILMIDLST